MGKRVPPILLTLRPSLFVAVRESAVNKGLSIQDYIKAVLIHHQGLDSEILDHEPEEIRRRVRG